MRDSLDEYATVFLEDLGIAKAKQPSREGEVMDDNLPMRRSERGVVRRQDDGLSTLSPYEGRRLSAQEREIVAKVREASLVQGGINSLVEQAQEHSGQQRLDTVIRLEGEFHRMLFVKRLAYTEDPELGRLIEPVINREIHDRANGALILDNIAEEIYVRDIERTYTDIQSAPRRRNFWDNVLGR